MLGILVGYWLGHGQATAQALASLSQAKDSHPPTKETSRPLQHVLENNLKESRGIYFMYKGEDLKDKQVIPRFTATQSVESILEDLLRPIGLTFKKIDNIYVIFNAHDQAESTTLQQFEKAVAVVNVSGKVVSSRGDALPGVTVVVKGTNSGTTTDTDGRFNLVIPDNQANPILVFSYIGFTNKEVAVNNQTIVNITLEEESKTLNEVMVVGYGTQKKSDITGTVASLPKERLEMVPNLNVAQAIQGAVAGVTVRSSSAGAQPDQSIMVRGRNSITANNDPLIIVDGIPYGGRLNDVNPNDIGSIEILKDASAAAIYGSRGSNGVILITTKEGAIGKTSFAYEGKYSLTDVTKVNRMLTGPEFYDFKMTRNAKAMTLSEEQVLKDGTWTDWTKLAMRKGHTQDHNLTVSGGFNKTKYYIGLGYTDIKGIAINDDFKRLSSRINVETKILDWLTIGSRTQLTADNASGAEANFQSALQTNPLSLPYDQYGKLTIWPWPDNIIVGNPLSPTLYDDLEESYQILSNNYAVVDFPFIKGLSYRLNTGVRKRFTDQAQYRGRETQSGLESLGRSATSNSVSSNVVIENILNYNREIGNHTIFFTGLYSYQGDRSKANSLSASRFPNDFFSWYASNQAAVREPSHSFSETTLLSQMARLNYSYGSRYLLTLTMRRDGYSGFGSKTKWGTFPSVAVGWNLANEDFFPLTNVFSELKLRASYGLNGNQAIGAYESLSQYVVANYSSGAEAVIGYKPSRLGLDNLGWESSRSLNLGMDFGIYKGRISGNLNWYKTNTFDLLLNRSISAIHGITPSTHLPSGWIHPSVTENIGETQNKGVELVINSRNLVNKFQWSTTGNLAYNKNKILSLYGVKNEDGREIDDVVNNWFIGQPISVNYDFVWDGVWQLNEETEAAKYGTKPGYVKLKDINGDGKLTADDRQIIGQKDPKLLWGISNTFSYGNFMLSVFIHGVQGATVRNYLMQDNVQGAEVRFNTLKKNWWTPENPTNDWVMNKELATNMAGFTGNIYENPDFIRIKDVSFAYDLPKNLIGKAGLSRLKVFATGRNLFTITKWTGMDPDLFDQNSQQRIPMQKEYVFGLSLGL
ncbi:SusC/RagA family TonB-linked outer membrane protein [Adhaeribacter aerolatus]|uniref:SusC/RagA family TonB-linked outer membrane protein n=2 Tax=Adhaeribacter aerolatus TaxID=670289 RepID=A0A512AW40_9BACT|nr:SusC/RagA family TonB-linked outer membrane protein [Adhaeribacter aerolatus]